ncbi:MAG TPA: AraC family transcriptional regulator, partial [Pyrinomonadaceae bacterium]
MSNTPGYQASARGAAPVPPHVEQACANRRVRWVIKWMRENLGTQITLADMAKLVNLSTWRFCHVFKRETGVTPLQYLKALRMERARSLLEETFLSVKQVMIEVGMNDESHFVRDFKAAYELPPIKFRQRYSLPAAA